MTNNGFIKKSLLALVLIAGMGTDAVAQSSNGAKSDDGGEILKAKEIVSEKTETKKVAAYKVLDIAEVMPAFPGGDSEMMKWLSENIVYPKIAEENGVQGRVIVKFLVDENGAIHEPKVLFSIDPSLAKEALRVVSAMPRWIPGKNNGVAVSVYFTLPVTFQLQ